MRDFGAPFAGGSSIPSGIFSGSVSSASFSFSIAIRSFLPSGSKDDCNLRVNVEMACSSLHLAHWKSSMYSVERTPSMQSERLVQLY